MSVFPELTPEEMLTEVNKAIAAVLVGGQSYRIGSRQLNRADLGMLRQIKHDLEMQLSGGGDNALLDNVYVAAFDRR